VTSHQISELNGSDVDINEEGGCAVKDGDKGENVAEVMVPFVAKIATCMHSGTKFWLPVRRMRR